MTRKEIEETTGDSKGFAKNVGAFTKGKPKPATLEHREFVETKRVGRRLVHRLTAKAKREIKAW
jgi:hypothetical protein